MAKLLNPTMTLARRDWLTLCGVLVASLFFAQSLYCFAEMAGAVTCCVTAGDADDHSSESAPDDAGCCLSICGHAAVVVVPFQNPIAPLAVAGRAFLSADRVPDTPVRQIEHPPQLS